MTRKIRRFLAVLGISGAAMFQASGCDTFFAQESVKGFILDNVSLTDQDFVMCGDGSYSFIYPCPSSN